MDTLPEERHGRAFTILAGVVQKLVRSQSHRLCSQSLTGRHAGKFGQLSRQRTLCLPVERFCGVKIPSN
jgi:hypothetical protein